MNHSEGEKQALLEKQRIHLDEATAAREYMNRCIDDCRAAGLPDSSQQLRSTQPLTGPQQGHYCFDFAQQVRQDIVLCILSPDSHVVL